MKRRLIFLLISLFFIHCGNRISKSQLSEENLFAIRNSLSISTHSNGTEKANANASVELKSKSSLMSYVGVTDDSGKISFEFIIPDSYHVFINKECEKDIYVDDDSHQSIEIFLKKNN